MKWYIYNWSRCFIGVWKGQELLHHIAWFLSHVVVIMVVVTVCISVSGSFGPYNSYKGKYVTFGSYEQDSNTDNGNEPIEWRVLDVENGKALLISKYILAYRPYNENGKPCTWEDCSLRQWLNDSFYKDAFTSDEMSIISESLLVNDANHYFGTDAGADTRDRVFCLSLSELIKYYFSGKWPSADDYIIKNSLLGRPTDASKAIWYEEHEYMINDPGYVYFTTPDTFSEEYSPWWLRTPGNYKDLACQVSIEGGIGANHTDTTVRIDYTGVRPCIWVDLKNSDNEVKIISE